MLKDSEFRHTLTKTGNEIISSEAVIGICEERAKEHLLLSIMGECGTPTLNARNCASAFALLLCLF